MKFYTVEKIGPKREKTPEGFLLCRDVPIARTGVQMYGPGETPIDPGPDGIVWIEREPEEVFRPETIDSASGKSLVNDHPDEDVDPKNWRSLTMGIVLNPRRGATTIDEDLLLCDLLVTDQRGIDLIDRDKVELSCGYDANYEETKPGHGRQKNIVINHVALVDQGRCGTRCSIGDKRPCFCEQCKEKSMAQTRDKKGGVMDMLRRAFKAKDEAELEKIASEANESHDEGEGEHTHVHVHLNGNTKEGDPELAGNEVDDEEEMPGWFKKHAEATDARFKDIEGKIGQALEKWAKQEGAEPEHQGDKMKDEEILGELEEEAPEGTGDKARKAKDSVYLEDSFQTTVAVAEIIVPGIQFPTFDRKSAPKKTFDALCALRRKTLELAYNSAETRDLVEEALGGRRPNFDKMTCRDARGLFFAIGTAKKRANSAKDVGRRNNEFGGGVPVGKPRSIAELNKANAEFYKNQS